jgi:hypothetical protein
MKETFGDYLQRLKDRRTEDDYKYTDEDFKNYIYYIFDCYEKGMSVYKCLEFMYFAERDMDDQLFNRESKQECTITKIMQMDAKMAYDSLPKQETLEEFEEAALKYNEQFIGGQESRYAAEDFINGVKWQQERSYSEEEVLELLKEVRKGSMVTSSINNRTYWEFDIKSEKKWFEQFKKK